MAFTDPQSVTINAVPYTLPRVSTEATKSVYSTADELLKMTVSHIKTKDRTRSMIRLDKTVVAADPFDASKSYSQSLGIYVVIDRPKFGFTATDMDFVVQALKAWATTANVLKVVGTET